MRCERTTDFTTRQPVANRIDAQVHAVALASDGRAAATTPYLAVAALGLGAGVATALLAGPGLAMPAAGTAALGLAALAAALAWALSLATGLTQRLLWDAAGVLALIGFSAGMVSDPQAIVQLVLGPTKA
jgi:hypothetical protein